MFNIICDMIWYMLWYDLICYSQCSGAEIRHSKKTSGHLPTPDEECDPDFVVEIKDVAQNGKEVGRRQCWQNRLEICFL